MQPSLRPQTPEGQGSLWVSAASSATETAGLRVPGPRMCPEQPQVASRSPVPTWPLRRRPVLTASRAPWSLPAASQPRGLLLRAGQPQGGPRPEPAGKAAEGPTCCILRATSRQRAHFTPCKPGPGGAGGKRRAGVPGQAPRLPGRQRWPWAEDLQLTPPYVGVGRPRLLPEPLGTHSPCTRTGAASA